MAALKRSLAGHSKLLLTNCVVWYAKKGKKRAKCQPLNKQGSQHHDECCELNEVPYGNPAGRAMAAAIVTTPRIPHHPTTSASRAVGGDMDDLSEWVRKCRRINLALA